MEIDPTSSELLVPTTLAEIIAAGFLARYPKITRDIYRIHLRHWWQWCDQMDTPVLEAQRIHIEAWARHLSEELGRKPQTVAGKLNAVCGLYKFAQLDGHILVNPGAHVRRPKIDFVSSTNGLTRPELADILRAAEAEGVTTHALMLLLGLNGLRITECLNIDVEHLGYQRGYRTLLLPYRKGGRVATLSLAVVTSWAVDQAIDGRTTGPLLLGRDGQRLKHAAVRRTVRRLCRQVGITKRVHPHSFRHSYITLALDAGVSEGDIAGSTGHVTGSRMIHYYDRNRGAIERNPTHAVAAFVGAAG